MGIILPNREFPVESPKNNKIKNIGSAKKNTDGWSIVNRHTFCRTCFSMGDLGVQVSIRLSIRPSVNIYPGYLVSATPLFETLQVFSSLYEDVHVLWI